MARAEVQAPALVERGGVVQANSDCARWGAAAGRAAAVHRPVRPGSAPAPDSAPTRPGPPKGSPARVARTAVCHDHAGWRHRCSAAGGRQIGAAVSHAAVRRSAVISCLMVTQAARLPLAARAIADFAAQTHAPRELVVLHDGDTAAQTALQDAAACGPTPVRVLACAPAPWAPCANARLPAARGEWVPVGRRRPLSPAASGAAVAVAAAGRRGVRFPGRPTALVSRQRRAVLG